MNKILTLGVIGVLVLAAIMVVFMLPVAATGGLENQYTIYVENADTGAIASASVDGRSLSTAEMLMLEFGGGIRKADFKPLAGFSSTVPILSKNANYNVWAVAKVKTTAASSIASIDPSSRVIFSGKPSQPTWTVEVPAIGWLRNAAGDAYISCAATNWVLNGETSIDQSLTGKFVQWVVPGKTTLHEEIKGYEINGMVIQVVVDMFAKDTSGAMVNKVVNSTLTITVSSWSEDQFSVEITNIGVGGPIRVMITPEILARTV